MFVVREGDNHLNHLYYVQYIKYRECVGGFFVCIMCTQRPIDLNRNVMWHA